MADIKYSPVALIVVDGFGIAPPGSANAVHVSRTPFLDSLIQTYPSMLLEASGLSVGLPFGEVGNSEVGHMSIGSGVLKYQSLPRIDRSIETGEFFQLPALLEAVRSVKSGSGKLHVLGLIGNGGVHASQEHLRAMLRLVGAEGVGDKTFLHVFLDGRDTAKDLGAEFMQEVTGMCSEMSAGSIASFSGRFYGMDRNQNWDRIQKSYDSMMYGKAERMTGDPIAAVKDSYSRDIFDERMEPTVVVDTDGNPLATVEEGDVIVFFNFRGDRARQLARAITDSEFKEFDRPEYRSPRMITFTEYQKDLNADVLYPPELIEEPLAKVFSDHGLKQMHMAETEKYAHVTFFMNGLKEEPFPGEDRILIPSPDVVGYDEKPEMSAIELTDACMETISDGKHQCLIMNYANPDMVGHTGDLEATVRAVETVDTCLRRVVSAVVKKGGVAFIVGDHGNAEELMDPVTGRVDKEHNAYPVPFIIAADEFAGRSNPEAENGSLFGVQPVGILADVAPTVLNTVGLPIPSSMSGASLL